MLNCVIITGRIASDIDLHHTKDHTLYTFRIANNRSRSKEITDFFNVLTFDKSGELLNNYMAKGDEITVQGTLQNDEWEDRNGNKRVTAKIVANSIYFGRRKKEKEVAAEADDAGGDKWTPVKMDVPF